MDNNSNRQVEMQYSLKEILWDILSQWKAVLIVSLLMALLTCGAKYAKDLKDYKNELKESAASEQETKTVADVLDGLSSEDRSVIDFVVSEQELVSRQKRYMKESILMQADPTNQRVLSLVFDIDVENISDLPVMVRAFYSYMFGTEVVNSVKPYIAPDVKDQYISELFYQDGGDPMDYIDVEGKSAAVKVNIVVPEEADAEAIVAAINKAYEKLSSKVYDDYPHTIKLASTEESHIYNRTLANNQVTLLNQMNTLETNLKNTQNAFTDSQKVAADEVKALMESYEEKENTEESKTVSWSKKYAVLGFVFGAIVYVCCYILYLMMTARIRYANSVEYYTGSRLLGEIHHNTKHKKLSALFHSQLVDKHRYKGLQDEASQMEKAVSNLEAACEFEAVKALPLISLGGAKEIANNISALLNDKGVENTVTEINEDIVEKDYISKESVAYVIGSDTKLDDVRKMTSLCRNYGIKVMGTIFVDAV